jgi:hypothetical protein
MISAKLFLPSTSNSYSKTIVRRAKKKVNPVFFSKSVKNLELDPGVLYS